VRFKLPLSTQLSKENVEKLVLEDEQTHKWLAGSTPKKIIVVPQKIVNIVV
jgi:leucyl-tRNA synthetase